MIGTDVLRRASYEPLPPISPFHVCRRGQPSPASRDRIPAGRESSTSLTQPEFKVLDTSETWRIAIHLVMACAYVCARHVTCPKVRISPTELSQRSGISSLHARVRRRTRHHLRRADIALRVAIAHGDCNSETTRCGALEHRKGRAGIVEPAAGGCISE